jgi:hypothetical protein
MAAETAAYAAIHALHQRSHGGRLELPAGRIEQIAKLRKEADVRFASLWGQLGAPAAEAAVAAVMPALPVVPVMPVAEPVQPRRLHQRSARRRSSETRLFP